MRDVYRWMGPWLATSLLVLPPAGAEPMPPTLRQAVLSVSGVRAADQEAYLAHRTWAAADLDGDGRSDYIVRAFSEGAGSDERCTNLVLRGTAAGLLPAGEFECCAFTLKSALLSKRQSALCGKRVAFSAGKIWPDFKAWTTRAQVKDSLARGEQLMREKKYPEARWLLCKHDQMRGVQPAELRLACGFAMLGCGDAGGASFAFEDAMRLDPDAPAVWLGLAAVARERKDAIAEAASYEKYLSLRPDAPDRAEVQATLDALKGKKH